MLLSKNIILSFGFLLSTVSCNAKLDDALAKIKNGETSVTLNDDQIGVDGAKALAEALKNSQLTKLSLHNTQVGDEGAKALAAALKDSQLTWLNLGGNQIGADGARTLADALKNSQLTQLDLVNNQIGAYGAIALAASLKDSQLTQLGLHGNQIKDDGAKALAAALKDSQLIELILGNNQIGDDGIWALKNVLKDSQLLELGLGPSYNRILFNSFNSIVGRTKSLNRIEENSIDQLNDALSALRKKHITFARNHETLMKAVKDRDITVIDYLLSLSADEFRMVGKTRKVVEQVLRDDLKQKITDQFKSLGISADENQVSDLIDAKLAKLADISKVEKYELIKETVESLKSHFTALATLKQKITDQFKSLGISADENQVSDLIDAKLAKLADISKLKEEALIKETVESLKSHFTTLATLKQKITVQFKSLGISADENQVVSDLIDAKLAKLDFSNFNEASFINETVESLKNFTPNVTPPGTSTPKIPSPGDSSSATSIHPMLSFVLASLSIFLLF